MTEITVTQEDRDLAGWFTRRMDAGTMYDEQAAKLIAAHRHEARKAGMEERKRLRDALEYARMGLERIHNSLMSNGPKQASGEMAAHFLDQANRATAIRSAVGGE